jgi:hypothetical protein
MKLGFLQLFSLPAEPGLEGVLFSRLIFKLSHKRRYQLGSLVFLLILRQKGWPLTLDWGGLGLPDDLVYHVFLCLISAILFWALLEGEVDKSGDQR